MTETVVIPKDCTCTTSCPESENPCGHCQHLNVYDPCPVTGYGCGTLGTSWGTEPCDCCSPEQRAAAAGVAS